jgi:hypothetical protein
MKKCINTVNNTNSSPLNWSITGYQLQIIHHNWKKTNNVFDTITLQSQDRWYKCACSDAAQARQYPWKVTVNLLHKTHLHNSLQYGDRLNILIQDHKHTSMKETKKIVWDHFYKDACQANGKYDRMS